ncbi:hypothetical protein GX586_04410 [bacterium]|nr:hypothetical protein [bacterium]
MRLPTTPFALSCALALAAAGAAADVIFLRNGDIVEGFATNAGDRLIVRERREIGEFALSTELVERIAYGVWIENVFTGKFDASAIDTSAIDAPMAPQTEPDATPLVSHAQQVRKPAMPKSVSRLLTGGKRGATVTILVLAAGFVFFSLVSAVCYIVVLVDAFKTGILWGLLCLFIMPAVYVYVAACYHGARAKVFFGLISPLLWALCSIVVLIFTP